MILRIRHSTQFVYDAPAYESHNEVRLAPVEGPGQHCVDFTLTTAPDAAILEYADAFGNRVHAVAIHPAHEELAIVAESVVERTAPPPARARDLTFTEFLAEDDARLQEHHDFLGPSRYVPLGTRLRRFFWQARPGASEGVAEYADRLVTSVRDQFEYEPGRTGVHSTVEDILATGGGVCQDFAHLTIGLLRLAGVPARYVSGYLAPMADPGGMLPGATVTPGGQATHAWIEALLPGSGWTGFDPTHRGRAQLRHVRIGVGRDYADVPPLRGVYRSRGRTQTMGVDVDVSMEQLDVRPIASSAEQ
jgi:transglutaminase-like putative cysteine protease